MNKKLLVILGISLAVNFVFIGFEAAKAIYQPAFPDIPPERPKFMPADYQKPDGADFENKRLMRKAFRAAIKNHAQEMQSVRKEVEEALLAEQFNTDQFKAAMQKATTVRSTIDAAVQENMLEMLSKMTPEERRRFAERFSGKKRPGFRHHQRRMHRFMNRPDHNAPFRDPGFRPEKGRIPCVPPCFAVARPCPEANIMEPPCRRPCGPAFRRHHGPRPCFEGPAEKLTAPAPEKLKKDKPKKERRPDPRRPEPQPPKPAPVE